MGGKLTKIVTFGTTNFVRYSRHVRYLGCPLEGKFLYFFYLFIYSFIYFGGEYFFHVIKPLA